MPRLATSPTRARMLAWLASVWPWGQWASPKSTTSSQSKISMPEVEVVGPGLVGLGADGPRSEAGARAVGGADVERGADDGDVRAPGVELLGLGEERAVAERDQSGVRPGRAGPAGPAGGRAAVSVTVSWPASFVDGVEEGVDVVVLAADQPQQRLVGRRRPPTAGRPRSSSGRR